MKKVSLSLSRIINLDEKFPNKIQPYKELKIQNKDGFKYRFLRYLVSEIHCWNRACNGR